MTRKRKLTNGEIFENHEIFKTEIAVMKNEIHHIKNKIDSHDLLLQEMAKDIRILSDGFSEKIDNKIKEADVKLSDISKQAEEKYKEVEKRFAAKWVENSMIAFLGAALAIIVGIVLKKIGLL